MTYNEFLEKTNEPNLVLALISVFYPGLYSKVNGTSMKLKKVLNFIDQFKDIEIPEYKVVDILDEMVEINKMVKDITCPSSFKNWFYKKKYLILTTLMNKGHCTKLTKCEPFPNSNDCLCLVEIDHKYKFHQYFSHLRIKGIPNYIKIDDETIQVTQTESIPFDKERFMNWKINLLLLGNLKKYFKNYV